MTLKENYERYASERAKLAAHPMLSKIHLDQEKRYVPPFNIYGPVWYVGDDWVCVHLIDTGDGLLLIDSGNFGAEALLIYTIFRAGFDPADVRWIIHSHGHLDHIGAARFFKHMFGTKLCLGAPDARDFRERPWISQVQNSGNVANALFTPDVEINDGDELTFGDITIKFRLCPGHTEGVISLFFEADGPAGVKRFGYYGGFGFNTLQKAYLAEIGDPECRMWETYRNSLAKVRDEKVDIMLGNHCNNNDTLGRRQRRIEDPDGPNPFIDETWWGRYLDQKAAELDDFIAKNR